MITCHSTSLIPRVLEGPEDEANVIYDSVILRRSNKFSTIGAASSIKTPYNAWVDSIEG